MTVLVLKRDHGGPMGGTCVLSRSAYYSIPGATSSSPASLPRVEPMWKSVRFLHGFFLMCFSVFILSYEEMTALRCGSRQSAAGVVGWWYFARE